MGQCVPASAGETDSGAWYMPANLTPDYLAAEERFRAAVTDEEKLEALDEMYATIPKHKGTEKLRADIKRRISKLRERERQSGRHAKRHDEFHVVKQGAGQIALIGPPNSGKSSLLARLTHAAPEIADYPFSTRTAAPGMMEFEDVLIQLVDIPPICAEATSRGVVSLARVADSLAVVLDLSDDAILDRFEEVRDEMLKSRTVLVGELAGRREPAPATVNKTAFVVANKLDAFGAAESMEVLNEFYGDEFVIQAVSAVTGEGLEDLRHRMYDSLGIIRVYTKAPGKPADMSRPFTLKSGSTLLDFAAVVHKDFAQRLRFARAWGPNMLEGAQIGRDHVLEDGSVIELHT